MRAGKMIPTLIFAGLFCAGSSVPVLAQANTPTPTPTPTPGTIAFNAPNAIHIMDQKNTTYTYIQITNVKIATVSNTPIPGAITLKSGAAIYPGFIDSHSHAISLLTAQSLDSKKQPNWISLANVNVMLLQNCSTGAPPGSTQCFMPVKTQGTVNDLLKNAQPNAAGWVLGWNYEPSRLACNVSGISPPPSSATSKAKNATKPGAKTGAKSNPTSTTSSGSPACKLVSSTSGCYKPVVNPVEGTKLARTGQLDEDLAIYAIEKVENLLAADYSGGSKEKTIEFFANQIQSSLSLYSQLGYTTVQEGAASKGLIETYMAAATSKPLPATMAFLEYDGTTVSDFACSVGNAQSVQAKLSSEGYDMFVAGMKAFADGSNQGYTGAMASPVFYMNRNKPFLNPHIFQQPYDGLA